VRRGGAEQGDALPAIREVASASVPGFLRELEALVAIPSPTGDRDGMRRMARTFGVLLADLGARVSLRDDGPGGPTLVARLPSQEPGARIAVVGHLDTVPPAGPGTAIVIDDGRAFGTGTADMKGGILALIHALRATRAVHGHAVPRGELVVVCGPDEEAGSPTGSIAIRELVPGSAAALVLEPARPGGELVAARKGMLQATVRVEQDPGSPVLSGWGGPGAAILAAARAVIALHAIDDARAGVSCTVGTIRSGRTDVILGLDLRAPSAAALAGAEAAAATACATARAPGVVVRLEPGGRFPPMERQPATEMLLARVAAVGARLGMPIEAIATGGASDANLIASLGVPVLDGLGPVGAGMHGPDEQLDLGTLPDRIALLAGALLDLASLRER
jgi:glutamate carboxypeptidase